MTRRDGNKSSLLCRSVAACSARSNCGSSPCSPPSGGCAWLRSSRYAANLTGPARDCLQSGRSGRRNSRLDRTKEHLSDIIKRLQTEVSTEYSHAPSAAETINASHTEILTVPTGTAVWYRAGWPAVPIRWLLVRDPLGELCRSPSSAPISTPPPSISSSGSSRGGSWRSPFRRSVPISASKLNVSGPIWRLCARARRCSACSRWLLSGRMTSPQKPRWFPRPLPGTQSDTAH